MVGDALYCTWTHRQMLPADVRRRFKDLDQFLRDLASSAKSRLLIVSPYLSGAGLSGLRDSLAVSAQRGAWIRVVTSGIQDERGMQREALTELLRGESGAVIRGRLRILAATSDFTTLFHAKAMVVDGERGYLGSANLSLGGLDRNFEIGTALSPVQAEAMDRLLTYFESSNLLVDHTESIISS